MMEIFEGWIEYVSDGGFDLLFNMARRTKNERNSKNSKYRWRIGRLLVSADKYHHYGKVNKVSAG